MRCWLLILMLAQHAPGDTDIWDLPPLRYSDTAATDPLFKLAADLASGARKVEGATGLERLKFVLKELRVPQASQVLVFSKTSFQNPLIHPQNPRSLYFSDEAYVGYVPGGDIEVIIQDPLLGTVFYVIEAASGGGLKIERDLTNCISCHGTSNTEHVPGMQVRSVFSDQDGHPLLAMGTTQVNHETPLAARWGGYYVTGRSSLPHLGNRTYFEGGPDDPKPSDLRDLADTLDISKYPRPTSDIVALLVLEHQCRMHNLLNAATLQYSRAAYLTRALDPQADPDAGSAGRVADGMAEKIVECLFFKDEADPGEGIEGGEEFQKMFESRYPRTRDGESLADFQLNNRIFKRRCSFMVYSSAFRNLPARVKSAVFAKMQAALSGEDPAFGWLKAPERKRIAAILAETLPDWPRSQSE
ncbi:MAG: hypothetical protein V4819_03175 [Verrucomicrobiota bacterium]